MAAWVPIARIGRFPMGSNFARDSLIFPSWLMLGHARVRHVSRHLENGTFGQAFRIDSKRPMVGGR